MAAVAYRILFKCSLLGTLLSVLACSRLRSLIIHFTLD